MPFRYGRKDDQQEDHSDKRSSLPGQRIPSIEPDKLGYGRSFENDPAKPDTVVLGHPEIAGTFKMNYDNTSINLDATPERIEENYVSAEDIRRRAKGSTW